MFQSEKCVYPWIPLNLIFAARFLNVILEFWGLLSSPHRDPLWTDTCTYVHMYIVHSSVYDRILGGDRRVRFIYIIMRRLLCCYDVVNSLKTQNFVGLKYRPHCYMFRRSLSSSDAPRSKTQFRLFEKMFLQYSALMQRYRGTLDPSVPELGELLKVTYFIYFQHVSSRRFYFVF